MGIGTKRQQRLNTLDCSLASEERRCQAMQSTISPLMPPMMQESTGKSTQTLMLPSMKTEIGFLTDG